MPYFLPGARFFCRTRGVAGLGFGTEISLESAGGFRGVGFRAALWASGFWSVYIYILINHQMSHLQYLNLGCLYRPRIKR